MTFITIKRESKYGAGKKIRGRYLFIYSLLVFISTDFIWAFFFFFFYARGFCLRIIANFFFFEFETALNQNRKSSRRRGEGSVLGGVAVFSRSRFSVWKELSQLQGSLRRALLHWTEGTRREAGRSECWEAAQKKKDALFSLSFLLLCCLHLSSPLLLLFARRLKQPRSQAAPPVRGYVCF